MSNWPHPIIANRNISTSSAGIGMSGASGPPKPVSTKYPMKEPIMKTSPWAKLSSFRIP